MPKSRGRHELPDEVVVDVDDVEIVVEEALDESNGDVADEQSTHPPADDVSDVTVVESSPSR